MKIWTAGTRSEITVHPDCGGSGLPQIRLYFRHVHEEALRADPTASSWSVKCATMEGPATGIEAPRSPATDGPLHLTPTNSAPETITRLMDI